jgi:hypothetical protein
MAIPVKFLNSLLPVEIVCCFQTFVPASLQSAVFQRLIVMCFVPFFIQIHGGNLKIVWKHLGII